ncbi:hypothetical protein H4W27_001572 [Nesterenkonia lutea]|uniref:Uncharacterized protein n=1 Tax=Nesterenkonia lutea TaxID=272919 RepID=A0ABR9JEV3_9MICC|nr:hypothetical protein [Nesterenkonia lutea]
MQLRLGFSVGQRPGSLGLLAEKGDVPRSSPHPESRGTPEMQTDENHPDLSGSLCA